ncbi:hypothetical protein [Pseudoalteromonas sp. SG43-3]|uniref:hypothetical protein n=1 Tax=Pseudoalteromonas sp. SG43-3 TaxID=2760970 RepID=UPI0015FFC3D8|nr:hypothetical protein [Pseudoalteromonas sp. SG43-3]MBB1445211.1 hypothetical protein [Pseudoalteromonas sp. SG43-3]
MSSLIRKVSKQKWINVITDENAIVEADAITGCTRTSSNTLSVWLTDDEDFDSENNKKLIAALASSADKPSTLDVVLLCQSSLEEAGVFVKDTPGGSPYTEVNDRHRDLINLNYTKLGVVSDHIGERLRSDKSRRLTRKKVIELVRTYVNNGIEFEALSEGWKKEIAK